MKLLLVDNFDSFTYNIADLFFQLGFEVTVINNCDPEPLNHFAWDFLVLGPGPGHPNQSGICRQLIDVQLGKVPILGICLGHQLIGAYFGAQVVRAQYPMHGKISTIYQTDSSKSFQVMRYHSLVLERETLPVSLEVTHESASGEIMGIRHQKQPIYGLQFHPESVGTDASMQELIESTISFF